MRAEGRGGPQHHAGAAQIPYAAPTASRTRATSTAGGCERGIMRAIEEFAARAAGIWSCVALWWPTQCIVLGDVPLNVIKQLAERRIDLVTRNALFEHRAEQPGGAEKGDRKTWQVVFRLPGCRGRTA